MHTGITWWDDERMRWYEDASSYSHFHAQMAAEIENLVTREESILELGCGLGHIAAILSSDGYTITATDAESKAVNAAAERSGKSIFRVLDASENLPPSDVLLMIYFGRIAENDSLDRLMMHCRKLIYILSDHKGQNTDRRIRKSCSDETEAYLKTKNVRYERKTCIHPFPQPLRSEEDALRYISRMYGSGNAGAFIPFLKPGKDGFLYELENMKASTIFTIWKEEK